MTRTFLLRFGLLAAALASQAGCIPITVSTRCREAANACLDGCPPDRPVVFDDRSLGTGFTNDTRNLCEKRCHDAAASCDADERK